MRLVCIIVMSSYQYLFYVMIIFKNNKGEEFIKLYVAENDNTEIYVSNKELVK